MVQLKNILFDLGHTLIDFRPQKSDLIEVYGEIRRLLLKHTTGAIPDVEELAERLPKKISEIIDNSYKGERPLEELQMADVVRQAFRETGIALPDTVLKDILLLEHESLSRSIFLAERAQETMERLKQLGFKVGLVSNATNVPELLRHDLERLQLLQHLDAAVFSSAVGLRKPHPTIYNAALHAIRAAPEATLFVGDRIKEDIRGPKSLGMRAVLTHQFRQENPDSAHPDGIIRDIGEIVDIVKALSE